MKFEFAKSLSGHDKNHIYLIHKEEETCAVLINGVTHGISNPKKKNKKHYQVIRSIPKEISDMCDTWQEPTDEKISQVIRLYEKKIRKKEAAGRISQK